MKMEIDLSQFISVLEQEVQKDQTRSPSIRIGDKEWDLALILRELQDETDLGKEIIERMLAESAKLWRAD